MLRVPLANGTRVPAGSAWLVMKIVEGPRTVVALGGALHESIGDGVHRSRATLGRPRGRLWVVRGGERGGGDRASRRDPVDGEPDGGRSSGGGCGGARASAARVARRGARGCPGAC